MKKQYNNPKLVVVNLEPNDIVTLSSDNEKISVYKEGYNPGGTQYSKHRNNIWEEDE